MYTSYDLRAGKQIEMKEIGGVIPVFAGIPSAEKAVKLRDHLMDLHNRGYYLCPSFDVEHEAFDSCRYWRGPVWPHMNWMLYHGFNAYGMQDVADILKADTFEIVDQFGFFEYYEPQKDLAKSLRKAYGGTHFSWTASSVIDLIHNP